jgi:hypothetical protein
MLFLNTHAVLFAAVHARCPPQMPEFHQRVSILQQLGYVSPDGTVTLKGRAACEINSTQVCCMLGGGRMFFWGEGGGLDPQ